MASGEETARGLGVRVERLRMLGMTAAALMAALVTAFHGVIAFVGLIAPHMARRLAGEEHGLLIPYTAVLGSLLLLTADTLGRVLAGSGSLPVGVVTSFLGAPMFLYLLVRGYNNEACGGRHLFLYKSDPVLADVTFSLEKGQVLCVLGKNGAGKSTLLKCLNRILVPAGGTVRLDGNSLADMPRKNVAKQMGYVPQRHGESRLTVFQTVLMGRRPHMKWAMTDKDHDIAEQIIDRLGLNRLAMRPVASLSGGEQQKVIIARALAQSPRMLLLDEPTSSLDLKNQLEVMGLVRQVVDTQGLSAIVAIHDLNTAVRFGDSFLFLQNHCIQAVTGRNNIDAGIIRQVYGVRVASR
ncbi:MAG: iron chelate uptake ABC transporter family permease subunit [Desulfotignum sp.]|nr:iron chelate uptake ABC transporter family permease subunit [Desulfotignum sp.]